MSVRTFIAILVQLLMFASVGFLYPAARGVDTETDNTAPCGGFELGGRTDFPLSMSSPRFSSKL